MPRKITMTRARESMEPWDLSEEDAKLIEKHLKEGTARPKFEPIRLPEYIPEELKKAVIE